MRALLLSTYELGHQPFGLASPAAWLREAGVEVHCIDLAVQKLPEGLARSADLIGCYVPMHTATRIVSQLLPRLRSLNPETHICVYGLYGPMNEGLLHELGADSVIGGEFEQSLVALARQLRNSHRSPPRELRSAISLERQQFKVPDRSGLPPLSAYACVQMPDGGHRLAGYTEATRGCKHLCRHCPIVPVYGGRFRVVQREVVLADVARQVALGAEHITFGDPDFFNGPAHALAVAEAIHERFPSLTYDVTIKVEHLLKHADRLPVLRRTGCVFVTSAVEALDERVLLIFDKRHTRADFVRAAMRLRELGLSLNPTFVAFTPWTSLDMYVDFLIALHQLELVANVAPIQYAIRLLIPEGSWLLHLSEVRALVGQFDPHALCYRWEHPDPRMDRLQRQLLELVAESNSQRWAREEVFRQVCLATAASASAEQRLRLQALDHGLPRERIPYLTEPWYC